MLEDLINRYDTLPDWAKSEVIKKCIDVAKNFEEKELHFETHKSSNVIKMRNR